MLFRSLAFLACLAGDGVRFVALIFFVLMSFITVFKLWEWHEDATNENQTERSAWAGVALCAQFAYLTAVVWLWWTRK